MAKRIKIISFMICFLGSFLFALHLYLCNQYVNITFEQLAFSLFSSSGASKEVIISGIKSIFVPTIYIFMLLTIPIIIGYHYELIFKIGKYKFNILGFNKLIYSIVTLIILVVISLNNIGLFTYISYQNKQTDLYEKYYVNPGDVNITFSNKRNLIYIFLESMENSYISIDNGGVNDKSIIPELEMLALENTNFSNNSKIGGAMQFNGTGWTAAAMISQTSATPLRISFNKDLITNNATQLDGVVSIGDILKIEDYNQVLMLGSSAEFGGRGAYFKKHGNYKILDYEWAIENNKIPKDYKVWWGFEDKKLFELAKDELLTLSKQDKPFNLTLLTADTHFPDGYIDKSCSNSYSTHYADSFACSSKMVSEFISWVQKQPFYDNTTIVISGDHLGMQSNFYKSMNNYERTVYNVFINPVKKTDRNKNRLFSTFDMFPTTLSSMGAEIENNKLGFGTDLFSNDKTLAETLGQNKFEEELKKYSDYYNKNIISQ